MKKNSLLSNVFIVLSCSSYFSFSHAEPLPNKTNTLIERRNVDSPKNREEKYNVYFYNNSDYLAETFTRNSSKCMYDTGPSVFTLNPGDEKAFNLEDSNNFVAGCTNTHKEVDWTISTNNDAVVGRVKFYHYDCPKGAILPICIGYEAVRGWMTNIISSGNLINKALCDNQNCLNNPVNDRYTIPTIEIDSLNQYMSKPLTISTPLNDSKNSSPYSFTPSGAGQPGATISYFIANCDTSDSGQCQEKTVTVGANGAWQGSAITLKTPKDYTVKATQSYKGISIKPPRGQAQSEFAIDIEKATVAISSPSNNSWLAPGIITIAGTTSPVFASQVQCYVDGNANGIVANVNMNNGTWTCHVSINSPGMHTIKGRLTSPLPFETDLQRTYMVAIPLSVDSPQDNARLYSPFKFSGTRQDGGIVIYQSNTCGTGRDDGAGYRWEIPSSGRGSEQCTFYFNQIFQGIMSPVVTRTVFFKQKPLLSTPSLVEQDTNYPLAGIGEPGAILAVSLDDGWFPIDKVTIGNDGKWKTNSPGPMSGSGEYTLSLKQSVTALPDITTEIPLIVDDASATTQSTGVKK